MTFLVRKVSWCRSLRQLTIIIKFTEAINEERDADLSAAIAKYKGVRQDIRASRILELTRSSFRTGVD
jgi:hypothetical protein